MGHLNEALEPTSQFTIFTNRLQEALHDQYRGSNHLSSALFATSGLHGFIVGGKKNYLHSNIVTITRPNSYLMIQRTCKRLCI